MLAKERKLNRWKDFDYTTSQYYFVTICTHGREELFGVVKNKEIELNEYGKIVKERLLWLENNFLYIVLNEFVVMPNHLHAIIQIDRFNRNYNQGAVPVGTGRDLSLQMKIKSLSEIIGAFKTTSSKLIHQKGLINFRWQRSFYDRVIRNERELVSIQNYILSNPLNWDNDRNNLENLLT